MTRKSARLEIFKTVLDSGGWLTGADLCLILAHINPSTVRLTALHMVDDGELERRRCAGKNNRGQAVEYRIPKTNRPTLNEIRSRYSLTSPSE